MATDEEVQAAIARVESLREELASSERDQAEREREVANDIHLTQLKAEAARLETQIAQQENSSSEEAVLRGAQSPIAAAESDLERATLVQKAVAESHVPGEQEEVTQPTPTPTTTTPVSPVAAPVAPSTTNKKGN